MVINEPLQQGNIIKIERIKHPVLVTSKNFFNQTGFIIGCPIFKESTDGPLHIKIQTEDIVGFVQCENITLLDLNIRGYSVIDRISLSDIMDITDAIQGIFDYI